MVVVSGLIAGAGFILMNYKKVKENILEIAKDIDKVKVKIDKTKKEKDASIHLRETKLATEEMVEDALSQLRNKSKR